MSDADRQAETETAHEAIDRAELFRLLDLASSWVELHHDALWEEEKHYAWWTSIMLPVLVLTYSAPRIDPGVRYALMAVGAGVGFLLSLWACLVIRREGVFLQDALRFQRLTVRCLGLDRTGILPVSDDRGPLWPPRHPSSPMSDTWDECRKRANVGWARLLFGLVWPFGLGIRSLFQLTFVVFALVFLAVEIVAISSL